MILQIGVVLLWFFFILELGTMTHLMAHNKLAVVVWASTRVIPLSMVTLGIM